MDNNFFKDLTELVEKFTIANAELRYTNDISGFKKWIAEEYTTQQIIAPVVEPEWEGKAEGRSPESVISTLLVHMNRYAERYSEAAIINSDFSTQDDFIYLINLKAFGHMRKSDLIAKNIHGESQGTQVIQRLEERGWIEHAEPLSGNLTDVVSISKKGEMALQAQMNQIRKATSMVAGDLTHDERIELIKILTKLELFHQSVFRTCNIADVLK
ncbi:MarR family winged helix-turn-helix transcriptional regulator [Chryseobacterium taichungense]|uniref:MarR family winged helix-turn-helix transcriptional regulator n=1 Tax=Chryseobacterium taichungense TaxID=295069 RepID=UPI0028ABF322|nr:MarR family transcriptional regulator [Chryseobacterium taichungense]